MAGTIGRQRKVLLIAPEVPPYGGVALQAQLLLELIGREEVPVALLPSNLAFPARLRFAGHLRGLRPFLRSILFCRRLWAMLDDVQVVHILACSWLYFFVVVCPAIVISRLRGKRVILNYHGGQADEFLRFYGLLVRPFFRMADAVTAPSAFLVEVIGRRIGVPVEIVANIVDLDAFRYRKRASLQPKMVVTRHLEKLYDIESVIRAFREVQRRYPDASLSIAGTGQEEKRLRDLVRAWQLQNVTFLGYVPHRELPALYDRCDILLNASLADNLPGSLVEAAAAGLVVVSTGVGGIPYMFESGRNALLVPAGDWAGLVSAVFRVLEDPVLASHITEEALRECPRYAWTSVWQSLSSVYGFDRDTGGRPEPSAAGARGSPLPMPVEQRPSCK